MAQSTRREELIAELKASRQAITAYGNALRDDLDVGARLKKSFRAHTPVWLGSGTLIGFLLSRIGGRKIKIVHSSNGDTAQKAGKAALILTVLRFVVGFAQPAIVRILKERAFEHFNKPRPRK